MANISQDKVPLAAEDKFIIIGINEAKSLCPSFQDGMAVAEAIGVAKDFLGGLIPIIDLRGAKLFYNDVRYFITGMGEKCNLKVLLRETDTRNIDIEELQRVGCEILLVKGKAHQTQPLDLKIFRGADDWDLPPFFHLSVDISNIASTDENGKHLDDRQIIKNIRGLRLNEILEAIKSKNINLSNCGVNSKDLAIGFSRFIPNISSNDIPEIEYYLKSALIYAMIKKMYQRSLLSEFVIQSKGNRIICMPYHAYALHEVEFRKSPNIVIARPGVLGAATASVFSDEIKAFENLLNDANCKEQHIQKFLEEHPDFLRGLNYRNVYPQLILERDNDSDLIPDFILEPFDGNWCDILDVKLPRQKIIVGQKDRSTLAAGIHQVIAQLREYSAYFDDAKHRSLVKDRYGLKVYKPRLIALVGRDMYDSNSVEIRRAMSQYPDFKLLTFDQFDMVIT